MSDIEILDSFLKQTKSLQEKESNFRRLLDRYNSMTWNEIDEEIINNHPTKYFEKIKQLNEPFKVKLELMGKFFKNQLDLLQVQQSLSTTKAQIGSPFHIGTSVLDLNSKDNENIPTSPALEIQTRSGRVTKRPLFYQDDVSDKLDDFKLKPFKYKLCLDKKEKSPEKTPEIKTKNQKATRNVLSKYDRRRDISFDSSDKKEKSPEKTLEPLKGIDSKNVRNVISKYEQKNSAIFDSLFTEDNKSVNDVNNSEEKSKSSELNDSSSPFQQLFSTCKNNVKRKHEDTLEVKSDDLDSTLTKSSKKYKGNRFFKSKNKDISDVISCDTSDSEDSTIIESSQPDVTVPRVEELVDDTHQPKLGRVTPPLKLKKPRNRKKVVKQPLVISQVTCPICNQRFDENIISEHAASCITYATE